MRMYLFYPQMIDYTCKILDLKFHFFNTSSKYFFNVFLGYCWEILLWIWFFFLWLQYTFSLRICWNSFWAFDVLKFHIHVWLSFLIHPIWHCMGPFQLRCYNFFPIWKKFSNNFLEYFPPSFCFSLTLSGTPTMWALAILLLPSTSPTSSLSSWNTLGLNSLAQ